jgi:hypothetical protein
MNVPIIYILALLISKEIFSYDGEKVVILCILSFLFVAYFQTKNVVSELLIAKSKKLEEEYIQLIDLKLNLEKSINSFWKAFIELENQLIEILFWVRANVSNTIIRLNKNRQTFFFHVLKDYINSFFKNYLSIKYFFQKLYILSVFNNIQLVFNTSLLKSNALSLQFAFNKLKNTTINYDFTTLLLNKLNLNHETCLNVEKAPAVFVSKNEKETSWVDAKISLVWL